MTRSQYRVYNRLRKKQVNHVVDVVEASDSSVTFHVPFPGLYLTYGNLGELLLTETEAERREGSKPLKGYQLGGEVGSDTRGIKAPPEVLDDDVPF